MSERVLPPTVRFVLPDRWYRIPGDPAAVPTWIDERVRAAEESVREQLAADLARVAAFALADTRPLRAHFAHLSSAIARGVQAYLTLDVFAAGPDGYDTYLAAVTDEAGQPHESAAYAQQVFPGSLAGERAVVVHDFLVDPRGSEGALQERYLAALFPREESILIEFQLTTPDLALFADIVEYGDAIATTASWGGSDGHA